LINEMLNFHQPATPTNSKQYISSEAPLNKTSQATQKITAKFTGKNQHPPWPTRSTLCFKTRATARQLINSHFHEINHMSIRTRQKKHWPSSKKEKQKLGLWRWKIFILLKTAIV